MKNESMFTSGVRLVLLLCLLVVARVQPQGLNVSENGQEDGSLGGVCAVMNKFDEERHKKLYRVGVLAIRGFDAAYEEFNKTFTDYLTITAGQRFDPPIAFEIKPLNFNLLFTDVEESIVDFIYVNPSAFSCIESEYTARSLVSQISRRNVGGQVYALKKFGGVMAARADRDDIDSIYDLKNKVIAAASISGLGSGQMQFLEMQRAGMSYINDPKQLLFTSNQGKVVNGVLSGKFDVGFIRTDQIERSTGTDGNPVNVSDLKIIEPRTNYIDGEPFPFTASTPLYPEWNVAALDHVPEDVSREVQTALIAIAQHAKVGRIIRDCQTNHNETFCKATIDINDEEIRCDTNTEVALAAVDAMEKGKYSGWQTTLSYMQLRSMQEGTGFIKQDSGTNVWRCVRSDEMYDSISCPEGYYLKSREEVSSSCAQRGLDCQEGFQCVCSPCAEIEVCYDGVEFRGDCVPYRVFLPALLVPIFVLILILVHCYVSYKRKLADSVWEVNEKELIFDSPPTVIGMGTFGYVLLAEYRGTQVAVKRVLPPGERNNIDQPTRDIESNPGLRSMAYGKLKKSSASGTLSQSGADKSLSRKQIKNDLVREMRQLSKLRHPCITTVMGAVLNRSSDPMLIMEYLAFGSLYDVLRDESLQTQVDENQMHILQDIARGLRFLHASNPEVIHGDLKARNVLIDTNFNAKVCDFGLSVKRRSGASGTPFWMPPELLENRSSNTTRSDIFSYGVLMYEIFARQNPYEGENPEVVLEQICDRTVNKRPVMPVNCPLKMNDLFQECVKWDPMQRPTAEAIDLLMRVEGSVKERVFRLENLNRDLAEANAKIASASAMQLQHFACMSHEIRTPLNCIVGISSLMESSDLSPEHRDNVKMIVSSGMLLRHIVDDVLDYSKLESGAMEVDVKEANLQDILADSVTSMASSPIAEKRNISIKTFYDARLLPRIETDGRRLQQIMYNLLSNAVKFSKQGGTVEISAKLIEIDSKSSANQKLCLDNARRLLRLTVKDYGKGIEEKELENIFHPFTQTKAGISNTEGGTGLGLSITRKLVEALGGTVSVESRVGEFSEFAVTFPHSSDIADIEDMSMKLKMVTCVLVDFKSVQAENLSNVFQQYDVDYTHFESLDAIRESWGSSFAPTEGRIYICLVRCSYFQQHVLESLFGDLRYDIITYGCANGLEKSSQHYSDPTITFPACFIQDIYHLAGGAQRTSFTRLPSDAPPSEDQLATIWKNLRVLVAEDNMVNQKVCRRLLNRIGVQNIVVVPDGQLAVEKDAAEEFDIILMDMQMPVMDGVEATRLIVRRNGPHPVPKIVFLSAHVSDSFKTMCLESGAVGYLAKPCTLDGLRDILTETVLNSSNQKSRSRRVVRFDESAI